uniref:Uncharacterized protein n=1 Tax=Meloidogyne incognita TaxID=6306 RepID=A0A914KQC1_MELIC
MRRPVLPNNENNVDAVLQPVENQGRHRPDAPTKILSDTVNQLRQDLNFSRAQYNELFRLHQQQMVDSREQTAATREALRASRADAAENREALRASRADAAEIREALRASRADAAENREALRASRADAAENREALRAAQNQIEQLQNLLRQNNILPPNNLNNGILQNGDPMNLDVYLGNEGVRNDVNYNEFVVQQPNNLNQRRNLNQIQNENILPGFQNIGQLPNMPQNNVVGIIPNQIVNNGLLQNAPAPNNIDVLLVNQVGEARNNNNNDFLHGGQQQNNPNNANRPMYNGQYGNHRAGNFPNRNGNGGVRQSLRVARQTPIFKFLKHGKRQNAMLHSPVLIRFLFIYNCSNQLILGGNIRAF